MLRVELAGLYRPYISIQADISPEFGQPPLQNGTVFSVDAVKAG